jgi:hypothetical protein
MAAALSIAPTVSREIIKPAPRIMRREGRKTDPGPDGTRIALPEGETSLDWTPTLIPAFLPLGDTFVRSANDMAIVRPGYEEDRLGMATDMYRIVDRRETVRDVEQSTFGKCTREGATLDGHGYHVADSFRLDTLATTTISTMTGEDLPIVNRLLLVHDNTGKGSVQASVTCYLGNEIVIGSKNFVTKLHVGTGARDRGVGTRSNWVGVIDAMLELAMVQQDSLAECLRKGAACKMTEETAEVFARHGVNVERVKLTKEETEAGKVAPIVPKTALDVVIAHHKTRRGQLSWGVWSRRLEGIALSALLEITGVALPRKGGR